MQKYNVLVHGIPTSLYGSRAMNKHVSPKPIGGRIGTLRAHVGIIIEAFRAQGTIEGIGIRRWRIIGRPLNDNVA